MKNETKLSGGESLKASLGLTALFMLVYGATNAYTATRSDVGTWVYSWEHRIPFVPLMIIPYMSIDLFFVAAPFVCTSRRELSILIRQIVTAIIIASLFFLVMPLRFSFDRPAASGFLGLCFDWFRSMDKPFNQFPSLHITLRTILAATYARHTRGWKRALYEIWFSLIGLSTLLPYQHHLADVAGGFLLGILCCYCFSDAQWRSAVTRSPRIGAFYASGSIVLTITSMLMWPWTPILIWPAVAMAIVATGYFGFGAGVFRKHNGRIPFASRVLLAPVIACQKISHWHYARRSNAWDTITDHVWIGRTLSRHESERAIACGVSAVLDLTSELSDSAPFARLPDYHNIPILDLTAPTPNQLHDAIEFINHHSLAGRIVYVHCKAGYSRSAAVVAAYLIDSGTCRNADEAMKLLLHRRPGIIIRPEVQAILTQSAEISPSPAIAI